MDSFFGIGMFELVMIAVIALIVLGPERLPGAMREVARWMRQLRQISGEFQSQFSEELKMLDEINPRRIINEALDPNTAPKPAPKPASTTTAKPATKTPATTAPRPAANGAGATARPMIANTESANQILPPDGAGIPANASAAAAPGSAPATTSAEPEPEATSPSSVPTSTTAAPAEDAR